MNELNKLKTMAEHQSILFIESDRALQKNFGIYLKKTFKNFYQAYDGADGLKQFCQKAPDIVLTNLELDKIDAIEMLADIKEENEDVIIISLSGNCDNYELLHNLDMGITSMLLKPINFSQLANILIDVLPQPEILQKKETPKTIIQPNTTVKKETAKTQVKEKKELKVQPKIVKEQKVEKSLKKEEVPKAKVAIKKEKATIKKDSPIKKEKKSIEETCMEDIQALVKAKEKVRFLNSYKGIDIHDKGEIVKVNKDNFEVKVSITQIVCAKYERHCIIKVEKTDKYIFAQLIKIDLKNSTLTLNNPKYIPYKQRDSSTTRVVVDKSFKASIFYKNKHVDFKASNVSFNSAAFYTKEIALAIEVGTSFDVTLGFDLESPNKMTNDKQFTKIFARAEVIRVDPKDEGINIIVKLEVKKSGQNTFKKYIKQRENEIRKEIRVRTRI